MPGGLDHIVHAVRDLDAAAEFYRRAGFTVGARNRHPWGTHNRLVQLKDFYIEILTVAEPEKIVPHSPLSFSFGAFHRDFLGHKQGLDMILLNSRDAIVDARSFETAKIGNCEVFDFAREGFKPDGTPVKLAFSLVFASDPRSPQVAFAACQHHFPENFWNPDFQTHLNDARSVLGAVMVAEKPADHRIFLEAFTGVGDSLPNQTSVTIRTANGNIDVVRATSFRDKFGVPPQIEGEGMTLNGLRIAVDEVDRVEALLQRHDVASQRHGGCLTVSPDTAYGATLIFETPERG
jgi:hypothetical protein